MACGSPLGETARLAVEERKVVSVLFCDLVDFTALVDDADPEDVRARLRPYHARVEREIHRFGGTMEKFIGDAVMAVFGAPSAHEDDAERAVRSALRIVEAIDELNAADPSLRLAVRVGVDTGEVVVDLAAEPRRHGLVAGDVVNAASRLQREAPVGEVVVAEPTYRMTKDLFEYEPLSSVTVKGKAHPIPIYRAIAPRSRYGYGDERPKAGPFLGREDQLEMLRRIFRLACRERSAQLVTLLGEPGIGKTRLVTEFARYLDDLEDLVYWRQGRCLSYGEATSFLAVGDIVKAQAGILESDPAADASSKLEAAVGAFVEDPLEREVIRQRLAPLVGLATPETIQATERAEYFSAWRRFLEGMANVHPLVLVIEDLHSADRALVEFLEYVLEWSNDVPMLLLCTARPELSEPNAGWTTSKRNATTITLAPLADEQMTRLISALPPRSLPASVRDVVRSRAEGNPLYAEELVAMLAERWTDAWATESAERPPARFPESIQAIIAARLDALSSEQKQVIQDAAVVGRIFWSGAVSFLSGFDESRTRELLHTLTRRELVRPARSSSVKDHVEFSFWHVLIRDVAYAQIPRGTRAKKHRAVAEWVQGIAGQRAEDDAEIVAYHYRQAFELSRSAGDTEEAEALATPTRRFLILAGDFAMGLDVRRARERYRAALDLFPPGDAERGPVLARAGEAAARAGMLAEAEEAYSEAIEELRSIGDRLGAGDTMVKMSNLLWRRGEPSRSREILAEALNILEREGATIELANAYSEMAADLAVQGREEDAVRLATRAIEFARAVGVESVVPRALSFRGAARCYEGDLQGLGDLEEALEIARRLGLDREAARTRGLMAEVLWDNEGPERALDVSRAGIELAESVGNVDLAMAFEAETLGPLFELGRWDELLRSADGVVRWAESNGERYFLLLANANVARVLTYRDDLTSAAGLADAFLPTARQVGDPQVLVMALAVGALVEQSRLDRAAIDLIEELERVTREGPSSYRARHLSELVRICVAWKEIDLAEELLMGIEPSPERHRLSLLSARAALDEAEGEIDPAAAMYREAAEGWRSYGFVLEEGQVRLGAGRTLARLGLPEASSALADAGAIFSRLAATSLASETGGWLELAAAEG